jgi:hypothetical protein
VLVADRRRAVGRFLQRFDDEARSLKATATGEDNLPIWQGDVDTEPPVPFVCERVQVQVHPDFERPQETSFQVEPLSNDSRGDAAVSGSDPIALRDGEVFDEVRSNLEIVIRHQTAIRIERVVTLTRREPGFVEFAPVTVAEITNAAVIVNARESLLVNMRIPPAPDCRWLSFCR